MSDQKELPKGLTVSVCGHSHDDIHFGWSTNLGRKGIAYIESVESVCWRKYKSRKLAIKAGKRTLARLFPGIVFE